MLRTHRDTRENEKSNSKEQKLGVSCQGPVVGAWGIEKGEVTAKKSDFFGHFFVPFAFFRAENPN